MLSDLDLGTSLGEVLRASNGNLDDGLGRDIMSMLREQRSKEMIINERERDLNICRSGSAPPTVQGSLNAVGSVIGNSNSNFIDAKTHDAANALLLSDHDIRSHPAYLSYYYSHENHNPRLPPPLLSKEDWRAAQRFQDSTSGIGGSNRRKEPLDNGVSKSLFSSQPPGLPPKNGDLELIEPHKVTPRNLTRQPSTEWLEKDTDGLIGLAGVGLGARRKSLADMLQEGLGQPTLKPGLLSRPSSHNAFDDVLDPMGVPDSHLTQLHKRMETFDGLHSGAAARGMVRVQSLGSSMSQSFASAVGSSLLRSTTPEAPLVGRSTACNLPPLGGRIVSDKNAAGSTVYGLSSGLDNRVDISDTLSRLSLSKSKLVDKSNDLQTKLPPNFNNQPNFLLDMPTSRTQGLQQHLVDNSVVKTTAVPTIYEELANTSRTGSNPDVSTIHIDEQISLPRRPSSSNLYKEVPPAGSLNLEGSGYHYSNAESENVNPSNHNTNEYLINQRFNPLMTNHLDAGTTLPSSRPSLHRSGNYWVPGLQAQLHSPFVVQLHKNIELQMRNRSHRSTPEGEMPMEDLLAFQKAYSDTYDQRDLYPFFAEPAPTLDPVSSYYYGSPAFGIMPYSGHAGTSPMLPSVGPGNPIRQNEGVVRFPSMIRSSIRGATGPWPTYNGANVDGNFTSSLLEEFKNSKSRCFELSDIVDHVVEFSADQYGSRFIQQKLETATVEEKNKIFPEIIPHARTLMTDVFGNYVVQKFFEHGTESQRRELASQLTGHVLPLSLQMYGCRVIQKALEVVDVGNQTQMVTELDGSIMKCVRDQNGNHVIQKCIECVPQDRIQFIVSAFYGQVVALSTHPYGCRVIQRVLEHCDDPETQRIIMEEIMQSVCTLAQDQYGNYVVQHVLQHGKPHERSSIINQLAGQIVMMSQQKFASNVVEKCLTFGGPEERQLLVEEMLGSTDENEPLQVMMKDPYGNYVVQKVLETCDNQSRELILSRIKVHLNTLKKYTYGKHIVARVEKLITAGERRMGMSSSFST